MAGKEESGMLGQLLWGSMLLTVFVLSIVSVIYVLRIYENQQEGSLHREAVLLVQDAVTAPLREEALHFIQNKPFVRFYLKSLEDEAIDDILSYALSSRANRVILDVSTQTTLNMIASETTRGLFKQLARRNVPLVNVYSTNPAIRSNTFLLSLPMLFSLGTDEFTVSSVFRMGKMGVDTTFVYPEQEENDAWVEGVVELAAYDIYLIFLFFNKIFFYISLVSFCG